MYVIRRAAVAAAVLVVAAPRSAAAQATVSPPLRRPTLVVMITVDQLRGDYIQRFRPQLTGGLARLARAGAWFTQAHHDHAVTETAPGHATLLSGRYPRSTGIASNSAGVLDTAFPLLDTSSLPEAGASPRRFRGTTLVDWIAARDPGSRALSVSMKDRGAILPIGRSRQNVFWYSLGGHFTTSAYYADALPEWLGAFNRRELARRTAGRSWTLLLPESAYPEPDSVAAEAASPDGPVFPHVRPADSAQAAIAVRYSPDMDELTLAAALEGVAALRLGAGPALDVLAVSLSATDLIGHGHGPDSREVHDQLLRVDRMLGVFLDSLFRMRDSGRVVVALSGDHGVGSFPELNVEHATPPPVRVSIWPVVARTRQLLRDAALDTTAIVFDGLTVTADRGRFRDGAPSADSVLARVAALFRALPGIARVDRLTDLARADTVRDPVARRWLHQFNPGEVDLVVTLTRMSIATPNAATHGTPYDYDTHVPLLLAGAGVRAGVYAEVVRTVDLAPTLAALLGVTPLERVDGVVLRPALR